MITQRHLLLAMGLVSAVALSPRQASAIKLDAGTHTLSARVGLSKEGSITPANLCFTINAGYDYLLPQSFSIIAQGIFAINAGSTDTVLFSAGARYRYQGLPWPVHFHGALEFVAGALLNLRQNDFPFVGGRITVGGDYYITRAVSVGLTFSGDLGSTISSRNAFYGQFNFLMGVNYSL